MLQDCLWSVVDKHEDGSISCCLLDSGSMTCEECLEAFERLEESIEKVEEEHAS